MEPQIMLFDDPTSALDPSLVRELVDVMARLANEGIAMIVVTNESYLACNVADRVILLDDGVWVEMAPPDELFTNSKKERTRKFLDRISLKDISGGTLVFSLSGTLAEPYNPIHLKKRSCIPFPIE
jgi:ABC-type polar amino acid transport system ATPase subunit